MIPEIIEKSFILCRFNLCFLIQLIYQSHYVNRICLWKHICIVLEMRCVFHIRTLNRKQLCDSFVLTHSSWHHLWWSKQSIVDPDTINKINTIIFSWEQTIFYWYRCFQIKLSLFLSFYSEWLNHCGNAKCSIWQRWKKRLKNQMTLTPMVQVK